MPEIATTASQAHAALVPHAEHPELPHLRIEPKRGWVSVNLQDLWQYRELLFFLAWRDVKVRYKQTALGAAWAVIQPLFTMLLFTRVLWTPRKSSIRWHPVSALQLHGPSSWQLFAYALTESSNSVVANERLITKVYFPRLIVPLASILAGLVDFAIAFVLVLGMMAWYHMVPTWAILTLPFFILFTIITALAVGLWLSALNVQYRDVRYTLTFIVQFWLIAIAGSVFRNLVPAKWRPFYGLNPMAGVIEGFRWALLGKTPAPGALLWVSVRLWP